MSIHNLLTAVLTGCVLLTSSRVLCAADETPLTGARLLSRIAQQPEQIRPLVFSPLEPAQSCDIAFVIDGTTSMPIEIKELQQYLDDVVGLLSPAAKESTRAAIVVYRDEKAPSGYVTIVRPLTDDWEQIREDLGSIEVESGEPYFTEAVDQGVYAALDQLPWRNGADTLRRIIVIGDAAPYGDDSERRKYRTSELRELAKKKNVRIDALLVNSGFAPMAALPDAPTRETAIKAAPLAREFFTALTNDTRGAFVDLWQDREVAALQEMSVILPISEWVNVKLNGKPGFPEHTVWREFLLKHVESVRSERPARFAIQSLAAATMEPLHLESPIRSGLAPSVTFSKNSPFQRTYIAAFVRDAIYQFNIALEEEPENAVLHLMLANAHLLLAYHDAYEEHSQAATRHIAAAKAFARDDLPSAVRHEIDGLHAVFVAVDRDAAIAAFGKLNSAEHEQANPGCRLRACWNLLALELTFWPPATSSTDETASRRTTIDESACYELIKTIVETWPKSVEAEALKERLSQTFASQTSLGEFFELPLSLFTFPRAGQFTFPRAN